MTLEPLLKVLQKQWGWGLLALLAVAAAVWAFRPRPVTVDVATVTRGLFVQTLQEDGRLRVKQRYVITAPVASDLVRPLLKVGDTVQAGQVVATLNPSAPQMIDERTRQVLEERLGSAESAFAASKAEVERIKAASAQVWLEAQRADRLAKEEFLSSAARDQAVLALRAQEQVLQAGQASMDAAEHNLREARAALMQARGGNRPGGAGRWDLKSPVTGQVIRVNLESGGPVTLGQAILEVANTKELEAVVDVLSSDALRVPAGAAVLLALGAGVPSLTGRVSRIEPVAFTKVSALGIEEQRVNLVIDVSAPATLGDGFRVDATIVISSHDGALLVPSAALVRDGAQWSVFVVRDDRAERRTVQLRDRTADHAWVSDGLVAGERVVLYPGFDLVSGQRVKARERGERQVQGG